jgi:hypothetical protein
MKPCGAGPLERAARPPEGKRRQRGNQGPCPRPVARPPSSSSSSAALVLTYVKQHIQVEANSSDSSARRPRQYLQLVFFNGTPRLGCSQPNLIG